MKISRNILKNIFLIATTVTIVSCNKKDDPKEIHDHEGIHAIEFSITEKDNTSNKQEIEVHGEEQKTFQLSAGKTYVIEIEKLENNDHQNILTDILSAKDEHFFVYSTTLDGYTFTRIDTDSSTRTDGKKMGLKVEITVPTAQSAKTLNIKLYHGPTSVSDTDNNNLGAATGETELDVNLTVNVVE